MIYQKPLSQRTRGRGTYDITDQIDAIVHAAGIDTGLCHLFVQHTSASLIICENADPSVRSDLERFMARMVPDGDPIYDHTSEGPDDMPAHVRSILTKMEMTLPVTQGRCARGIWQGIYLYEHRHHPHERRVIVTVHD